MTDCSAMKSVSLSLTEYHVKYIENLSIVSNRYRGICPLFGCADLLLRTLIRGNNMQMGSVCVVVENSVDQIEASPILFCPLRMFYCVYINIHSQTTIDS